MELKYMRVLVFASTLCAGLAFWQSSVAQDYYGVLSASGVYAEGSKRLDDEEDANRSAVVLRGQGGARWMRGDSATEVSVSSHYYEYLDEGRQNRWNNEVEIGHEINLADKMDLRLFGSAGTDYATLEYRSADQMSIGSEIFYRPSRKHRLGFRAEYRYREYDDPASSNGSAPYVQATYRYQMSSQHRVDFDARYEWVDTNNARFDYDRQRFGGFYTRTFDRRNRLRVGAVVQNWEYDTRLASAGGERLHSWRIRPQVRFTRAFANETSVELDYRRDFRRSNDSAQEEDGNRLSLTVRKGF